MNHPMQPIYKDDEGVFRFKENAIVAYLLDNGGIDMNEIAHLEFSKEDRQQFAQLIGYSLSGYGELYYVTDYAYDVAESMKGNGVTESQARITYLENQLKELRESLRDPMANLFGVHPRDLMNNY